MFYGKYESILNKIKQVRKKNNKTQEDVAKYLGITKQAYFRYEKGTRKMSITTLYKIANYFNLPQNFFLQNDVSISDSSNRFIYELIEYFETISIKLELKNLKLDNIVDSEEIKKIKLEIIQLHEEMIDIKNRIISWLEDKTSDFDYYSRQENKWKIKFSSL